MSNVYVSPTGNDDTGDGTSGNPWETIANAKTRVVELGLVGVGMTDHCTINLAPYVHRLSAKLSHGLAQSGQNGYRLRYVGQGRPGSARILASQRVTDWTVHAGSVWKATIGTTPIHTLYDNGRRAYKARWPKHVLNVALPMAKGPYIRAEAGTDGTMIQYPAVSMDPGTWGSLAQLEVVVDSGGSFIWFTDVVPVQSINTGTRQITLTRSTRYDIMNTTLGSRFYCQNALALLTQAGEFFHDTTSGVLYYWPWTGVDPNLLDIEAPLMTTAIEFLGTDGNNPCHDIELNGVGVFFTDFTDDYSYAWRLEGESGEGHVYGAYDRIMTRPEHRQGIVTLTDCQRITFRNVELGGAGYNGIYEHGFNQDHDFRGTLVRRCGMGGHYRDGGRPGEGDVSRDNRMSNALFAYCGELLVHGAGVTQINAGHNDHDDIAIHQCAGQGYAIHSYSFGGGGFPTPDAADLYAEGNVARRVFVRDVCQDRGDVGAMGVGGIGSRLAGPAKVNTIDGFDIYGVISAADMYDQIPDGLFSDNEAKGQVRRNGWIGNTAGAAARENSADSVGTQTYENVQGVSEDFDGDLVPPCGVTAEFPFGR
jgi:hypothetical protein